MVDGVGSGDSNRFRNTPEFMAQEAEREANRRIQRAEKRVQETEVEANARVEKVRDEYDRRAELESFKGQARVENEKMQGYEHLRGVQRMQAADTSKVRREGERDLANLTDHYKTATQSERLKSDEEIENLRIARARQLEFERKQAGAEVENLKKNDALSMQQTRDEEQAKLDAFKAQNAQEFGRLRDNTLKSTEQAKENFESRYTATRQAYDKTLGDLDQKTSQQINEIRQDTAQKLSAYSSRQRDPFYRMMEIDARLESTDDAFILRARIPEHEQPNVTVNVRGGQLVINGHRRNSEKLALEPGHEKSSSSYQSFFESFPLNYPVDPKGISRESDGDELVIRVPKKLEAGYIPDKRPKTVARARAERPQFPTNLPEVEEAKGPSKRDKGTGTLA